MSIKRCSHKDCDLDVWKEHDKCILHCLKNTYQKDRRNDTLAEFYEAFKQYIINELLIKHYCDDEEIDSKIIAGEITSDNLDRTDLKECFIHIKMIVFPKRDGRDSFDYLKILNNFGEIHFNYCEFYATYLKLLPRAKVFFQDCIFYDRWNLHDYNILENIDNVIYQTCYFKDNVTMYNSEEEERAKLLYSQFDYTCVFDRTLKLRHIEIEKPLFNTNQDTNYLEDYSIPQIELSNCIFNEKFILDNCKITVLEIDNSIFKDKFYINKQYSGNTEASEVRELSIKNSTFKENFKLHNCMVDGAIIEDTDFEKHADFFKSVFKKGKNDLIQDKSINLKALNFKGLALFGDCEFHELLRFQYVTFENFSHFRRAKFLKGLDLDYTNIQKEMNFFDIEGLDSKESKENTSQETYRIIKHNFSKIGNTIEANKYHTLELATHNKKTWEQREITPSLLSDGIVSFLFWVTSNFSKYWFLPLFWIFIIGAITAALIGEMSLANIIKYATITKMDYMDKHPILFVFNKASLGFLYYQFILSVRKNTRK